MTREAGHATDVPGIHWDKSERDPWKTAAPTGVPLLIGLSRGAESSPTWQPKPHRLTRQTYPNAEEDGLPARWDADLATAVSGFFENGGEVCWILALPPESLHDGPGILKKAFEQINSMICPASEKIDAGFRSLIGDEVDLVAAPGLTQVRPDLGPDSGRHRFESGLLRRLQKQILEHCGRSHRFAILDPIVEGEDGGDHPDQIRSQREELRGSSFGAIYYPRIRVTRSEDLKPPSGHLAGLIARVDREIGVHRAPANFILEGVVDLGWQVQDSEQEDLNHKGINCIRFSSGRGIRVWGARTLSFHPEHRYINVRRFLLMIRRQVERKLSEVVFEPHDSNLQSRIERELKRICMEWYGRGALRGSSPKEAFRVKCDDETNPPEAREAGYLVAELGLAPTSPGEFVWIRVTHSEIGAVVESTGN